MLSNAVLVIFDQCSLLLLVALTFHQRSFPFSLSSSRILPLNYQSRHLNSLEFWSLPLNSASSPSAKVVKCLQAQIWDDLEARCIFLFFFSSGSHSLCCPRSKNSYLVYFWLEENLAPISWLEVGGKNPTFYKVNGI